MLYEVCPCMHAMVRVMLVSQVMRGQKRGQRRLDLSLKEVLNEIVMNKEPANDPTNPGAPDLAERLNKSRQASRQGSQAGVAGLTSGTDTPLNTSLRNRSGSTSVPGSFKTRAGSSSARVQPAGGPVPGRQGSGKAGASQGTSITQPALNDSFARRAVSHGGLASTGAATATATEQKDALVEAHKQPPAPVTPLIATVNGRGSQDDGSGTLTPRYPAVLSAGHDDVSTSDVKPQL